MWLGLAGEVEGKGRTADDLAYLRDAWDFRNLLLVERPNGDFGHTLMRQFLFDAFHLELLKALAASTDPRVAEIAAEGRQGGRLPPRALLRPRRSASATARDESHRRMQDALDALWPYTGEMFVADEKDAQVAAAGIAPDPASLRPAWEATVRDVLTEATLTIPDGELRPQGRQARRPYRASRLSSSPTCSSCSAPTPAPPGEDERMATDTRPQHRRGLGLARAMSPTRRSRSSR